MPYLVHDQFEVTPPTTVSTIPEDTHARMDCIEQHIRQLGVFDSSIVWDDLNGILVANLPTKLRDTRVLVVPTFIFDSIVL